MLIKETNKIVFKLIVSMQSRSNSTIWFSGFYTQTNYNKLNSTFKSNIDE